MGLIHEQFPHIGGLADSSTGKCQQFDIVSRENGYIQILHAGSMHWICVENMISGKSSNQQHYVFDGLFLRKIQQDVILKFAVYSFCPENELIIHVMSLQQQKMEQTVDYFLQHLQQVSHLAKIHPTQHMIQQL